MPNTSRLTAVNHSATLPVTTPRRQQILDTAAKLFAERGFHGVSVHDIGGACGISGPALYKHFAGKDDILAQSLTAISERCSPRAGPGRASPTPSQALDALIAWHIDFALGHPALIVIQEREWTNLDATGRKEVRSLQLAYIDIWVDRRRPCVAISTRRRPRRRSGDVRPAQLDAAQRPHQATGDARAADPDGAPRAARLSLADAHVDGPAVTAHFPRLTVIPPRLSSGGSPWSISARSSAPAPRSPGCRTSSTSSPTIGTSSRPARRSPETCRPCCCRSGPGSPMPAPTR